MISDLLQHIKEVEHHYQKTFISANEENIQLVKDWVSNNIRHGLWVAEYEDFLNKVDGLEFNGLIIYNTQADDNNYGIIAANEIWRENQWDNEYLFFGDSDISWYCLDIDKNVFVELDKPSGYVVGEFSSFNEMIEEAITSVLI
ncbi:MULTISPECIES: YrhA family protein [Bacillus]|uniref:SMI1 / KNR4 family protein n=1 Tax=Bacillus glycinifermentans TaxID=1664069 RepID=A0AAJ3YY54_9BACI|nr:MULTISPECIES: YrhA family protein [Bacillus]HWO76398.1 YrhA family protein [Bacillus sp. (in: firmicutes)]KKB71676.1 SMI1 / KNR4 family protein [Bacillus sp. TH008]MDU0069717.1 YrhA family protein [Bacillus sp. IG6]MED8018004.1 YrhA family protein [Bacillus glycinifermentans]QAT65419.1 SMI1 / KNR4 family protein [Bacillus glycinifermentans]